MNQMLFLSSTLSAPGEGQQGTDVNFSVKNSEQVAIDSGFAQLVNQQISDQKGLPISEQAKQNSIGEATKLSSLPVQKEVIAAPIDLASMTDEQVFSYFSEKFPQFDAFFSQLPEGLQQSFQAFIQGKELSLEELQALQIKLTELAELPVKEITPITPENMLYLEGNSSVERADAVNKLDDELKGLVKVIANELQRMIDAKRLSGIIEEAANKNEVEPPIFSTQQEPIKRIQPVISPAEPTIDDNATLSGKAKVTDLDEEKAHIKSDTVGGERLAQKTKQQLDINTPTSSTGVKQGSGEESGNALNKGKVAGQEPIKFAEPITPPKMTDADIVALEQSHRRALVLERIQNYLSQSNAKQLNAGAGEMSGKQAESSVKNISLSINDGISLTKAVQGSERNLMVNGEVVVSKEKLSAIANQQVPEVATEIKHHDSKQVIAGPIKVPVTDEQIRVQTQQAQQKQHLTEQQEVHLYELSDTDEQQVESLVAKESNVDLKRQLSANDIARSQSVFVPTSQAQTGHTQIADTSLSAQTLSDFDANVAKTLEANLQRTENATRVEETISILKKDFPEAMKEKALMMINLRMRQVDIRLDPPELGSMQVKLNMQGEQAQLNIVVQNQAARDVLEQQMPRLRELLSEQGVDLGETHVKQEQKQQQDLHDDGEHANQQHNGQDEGVNEVDSQSILVELNNSSASGIDYYA